MSEIRIDADACIGCGECVSACLYGGLTLRERVACVDPDSCTLCGSCVDACPAGCISRPEEAGGRVAPDSSGIWVCGEVAPGGNLHASTLELLTIARDLAADLGEEASVVVVANDVSSLVPVLSAHGAGRIFAVEDSHLDLTDEEMAATLIAGVIQERRPSVVLMGATPFGRSVAPRIAAKLQTGLTADCTQLQIDPASKLLLQTRPAFGGNLMARIVCPYHRPQMATVRPGVFRATPSAAAVFGDSVVPRPEAEVVRIPVDAASFVPRVRVLRSRALAGARSSIESAETIVAGGLGLGSKEGFALAGELAEALGGVVGASRAAVDEGWASASSQVGQTGKTVSPRLYVALGISGAIQHTVGMQGSGTIVAVNSDPHAAIFQVADIGVVAPAEEAVPRLIEMMRRPADS